MTADLNLVLADLAGMATRFHQQAKSYAELTASVTPPRAPSGDSGLDETIASIMAVIESLHADLGARIETHGDKLSRAHDSFDRQEIKTRGTIQDLIRRQGLYEDLMRDE